MNTAADLIERSVYETLTYYAFPDIHRQKIRTTDEIDKYFFVSQATLRKSPQVPFFCSAVLGHSSVPAIDLAAAERRGGQGWPHLRPPQARP